MVVTVMMHEAITFTGAEPAPAVADFQVGNRAGASPAPVNTLQTVPFQTLQIEIAIFKY
ncbi:MAG: hypothetical protein ABIQ00_08140 [Chitinophagaceae bacterium]